MQEHNARSTTSLASSGGPGLDGKEARTDVVFQLEGHIRLAVVEEQSRKPRPQGLD